jgi:3',5'-cyclic AMP phosphodiesterase CpdA
VRIIALSDQHGFLPDVPACDLLIVAGDVCPDAFGGRFAMDVPERQRAWFDQKYRPWLDRQPATHKVITWGNHDWCGQSCDFSADAPPRAASTSLQIVTDALTTIDVGGERLTIWASPWSNQFGYWAFMKRPRDLAPHYDAIPEGIDLLVSHQPPYGYGDVVLDHLGSRELLAAIDRVRPRAVICGHIHEGHGCYEHAGTPIHNVSVVDEYYQLVHTPTLVRLRG